jgi:hypothetical protein
VSITIGGLLARLGEDPRKAETRSSVAQTFAGVKETRLTLERLKEFLFAIGRPALAHRRKRRRRENASISRAGQPLASDV